jgi:hypothetical protein
MKLPAPPSRYDPSREADRNRLLEQADLQNHKRGRDLFVAPGRVVIVSPDGTAWALTVSDTGTVSAVKADGT